MKVRRLSEVDVEAVVRRVETTLAHDARRCTLLNANFDAERFGEALHDARGHTWVALENQRVVGHLYGALLTNDEYGAGAWIGPDGVSCDRADVLEQLYAEAATSWIARGATEHYAWVFDDPGDTAPWYDLGFARMHTRGVTVISLPSRHDLRAPYQLRRGGPDDLELAVELDTVLDEAQRDGPSFVFAPRRDAREELRELLEDPEVTHYVIEDDRGGVAQCLTFPLEARRGTFPRTLHLSAVTVRPEHQHRGLGRALVNAALADGYRAGFSHAEANWRVTNRSADRFWRRYGFGATYVRLHRTIGPL